MVLTIAVFQLFATAGEVFERRSSENLAAVKLTILPISHGRISPATPAFDHATLKAKRC